MDIWEANKISAALTPHPCLNNEQHSCEGNDCGGTYSSDRYAGDCDPDGTGPTLPPHPLQSHLTTGLTKQAVTSTRTVRATRLSTAPA